SRGRGGRERDESLIAVRAGGGGPVWGADRVAEPLEAQPRGLVVVGDQVFPRAHSRYRRDLMEDVGALERDLAPDPRARADGQVARIGSDRTRPEICGVQV